MAARLFALSLVLLFGVQAVASGNFARVCRYSGKIVEDCPCPEREPHAALSRQPCCEVRQSSPFAPSAIIRELPQLSSSFKLLPPPPWLHAELTASMAPAEAWPQSQTSPDERDRYLRLRTLLN